MNEWGTASTKEKVGLKDRKRGKKESESHYINSVKTEPANKPDYATPGINHEKMSREPRNNGRGYTLNEHRVRTRKNG